MTSLVDQLATPIGVYSTAPTCYLSARARIPDFAVADLDRAIGEERSLVRVRTMRSSAYMLPMSILPDAVAATRHRVVRSVRPYAQATVGDRYEALGERIENALNGRELSGTELRNLVDPERQLGEGMTAMLGLMGAECRIVRTTTEGGWRSNRLRYARWADWLPDVEVGDIDGGPAQQRLAARYVAAYGPITPQDLQWWAGWTKSETAEAIDGLDLDSEGNAISQLPGVRLLPVWDVLMVAYRERSRLLDEDRAQFVYDRFGNATSVVLVNGRVGGVWDLGRSDDPLHVAVAPFETWSQAIWDEVETQVGRIASMIGATDMAIARRDEPRDLTSAPRNAFLSPLSG